MSLRSEKAGGPGYTGKVKALILDWSGTVADAYVLAPAVVFVEVFKKHGVEISMEEARGPMGLRKDLHIKALTETPEIGGRWAEIKGKAPGTGKSETDIQMMFNSLKEARQVFERDYIRFHLSRFSGNVSRTAEFIGMERSALHRKLKLLGLSVYSRVQVKVWVDKKGEGAQIEVKTRSG